MEEQNEKEGLYLKGIKLPAKTILPTHKHELKKALFEYRHTNKATILEVVLSGFNRVIGNLNHTLTSRQPVWRTSLVIVVLALVVGLSIMIPPFIGQDKEVIAADEITQILRSDNQTRALLDQGATWDLMEEGYKPKLEQHLDDFRIKLEEESDDAIISQEINLTIMVQRMLVEIILGNEYYYADVDIKNGDVLAFGQKGDPDLRAINPRFDIDFDGKLFYEERGATPFGASMIGTRGFEGIETYIDPFYADTILPYPNFTIPDLSTPPILE